MVGVTTFMRVKSAKYEEKLKLAFCSFKLFQNIVRFSVLNFESLGAILEKLAYEDNTHYGPITRLLVGLKTFIKNLSAR